MISIDMIDTPMNRPERTQNGYVPGTNTLCTGEFRNIQMMAATQHAELLRMSQQVHQVRSENRKVRFRLAKIFKGAFEFFLKPNAVIKISE